MNEEMRRKIDSVFGATAEFTLNPTRLPTVLSTRSDKPRGNSKILRTFRLRKQLSGVASPFKTAIETRCNAWKRLAHL
jgi:hypothetical protein